MDDNSPTKILRFWDNVDNAYVEDGLTNRVIRKITAAGKVSDLLDSK